MRSPIGNNGNLKNNWRKEVRSFTRFSWTNIGTAGYPAYIPDDGYSQIKTPRRLRFFRHEIRNITKERALLFKKDDRFYADEGKIDRAIERAQAYAALATGTSHEDEAKADIVDLQNRKEALLSAVDTNLDEIDALTDKVNVKNALLKTIVEARYNLPFPRPRP